ncbi:MAG: GntR family transcriptional regulator [Caldilineae bacterium]|nr:MAG: GntR family transcriptional regulator [Caldilineae bacterium]
MSSQTNSAESRTTVLKRKRLVRASLAQQVADALRDAIIRGELKAGTRLVEMEIAAQMGTSQAPVREALQRLEQDGLVARRSRSATYVTEISMEEMYEITLVRKVVETIAACHTARYITPEQCDELEELVQHMHEVASVESMPMLARYDMAFHSRIVEWSRKDILVRVWTPLKYQVMRFLVAIHPDVFSNLAEVAELHMPIIEAMRKKDPAAAMQAVEDHIMLFWNEERITTYLNSHRELTALTRTEG